MKRLYRSERDKRIAGVCGGLGEYFDIDPTIVRLICVIVGIGTGVIPFLFGYFLAWLIVPQAPQHTHEGREA